MGPVTQVLPPVGGIHRYVVFLSANDQPTYAEDQLVRANLVGGVSDSAPPALLSPEEFRNHLTAIRLNNPQSDHIYALRAARIRYVPFQFKPLIRLLRSDRPRMLIADEVGVGKTIEAGLILRELQARKPLDRVLVLCPKALVTKWQAEMRRFDESFRILDGPALRYCLHEAHVEGAWPAEYSRSIVHYELARREEHRLGDASRRDRIYGLEELDPPPSFDLVIADEAHHVRNPESLGYKFLDYLQRLSDAVVLLSATPVQTKATDLFWLLHLLRSDLFPSSSVFAEQVEPNRHLSAAVRALRSPDLGPGQREADASSALDEAASTPWGKRTLVRDPLFTGLQERLTGSLSNEERVAALRDLEELHSLANVMNRTRRRDIGRFTIREPHTVRVRFTTAQQRLYDEVVRFRAELLLEEHDPFVVTFVLPNIERQAASSINALAESIEDFLDSRGYMPSTFTDDPEFTLEAASIGEIDLTTRATRVLAAARDLPVDDDPKIDALNSVVEEAMSTAGPGKVLVFSFFVHTVEYVARALRERGRRVAVIHGGVPEHEREQLRQRFRLDRSSTDAIDVLVSSEVGCEGLDFEFCDRMVNFDLPWNPMKVEQRIGRIDRYGQRAEKVFVYNLVTDGTVEDRVWFRCFDRLGVFRDTVGDLEEVLGELTEALGEIVADPTLNPDQAAEKALQTADNAVRLAEEHRRIEEGAAELFGVGDAISAEVNDAVSDGRFVSPEDLERLISSFMAGPSVGGRLVKAEAGLFRLRLRGPARARLSDALVGGAVDTPQSIKLQRRLDDDDLRFTFDDEIAADRRDVEFVTPVHPLARAAAAAEKSSVVSIMALVAAREGLERGTYEFRTELWEHIAARPDRQLHTVACTKSGEPASPETATLLVQAIGDGVLPDGVDQFELEHGRVLEEAADQARRDRVRALRQRNEELVDRRMASEQRSYELQRVTLQQYLDDAAHDRIRSMRSGQLARLHVGHDERLRELEAVRDVDIVTKLVATGRVEVR
jgi:superfamily II DNA or RNA helicase